MNDVLRIAALGLTHDHVWDNLASLAACEEAELVAAADPNAALTARISEEYGCPVYASAEALFEAESNLDAVYVFGSNAEGAALSIRALERGLHVLVEKPMAANLAQAEAMLAASRASGAKLVVNWPFAWWPQLQEAMRLAQDGAIGKVWGLKYRAAHAGPKELGCSDYFCDWLFDREQNGGGAMMDYCCYGCVLAAALMGLPEQVAGMAGGQVKAGLPVEDNALIAMKYPFGMATAEASWTQIGKLTSYTTAIYGTKGTLLIEPRDDGKLLLATEERPEGVAIEVEPPEPWKLDSARHFVEVVKRGAAPLLLCRADFSRDAQEILEAGFRSASSGTHVSLPLAGDSNRL